jgi:hypothetical protein
MVMIREDVRAPNEAIVLSRTIKPTALAAEKTQTSQSSRPEVRRSSRLGQNEPVAVEATEATMAMRAAKTLV